MTEFISPSHPRITQWNLQDFEWLGILTTGKIPAYDCNTGQRLVDRSTLPRRKMTEAEILTDEQRKWRRVAPVLETSGPPNNDYFVEGMPIEKMVALRLKLGADTPIISPGVKAVDFSDASISTWLSRIVFKLVDVIDYEQSHGLYPADPEPQHDTAPALTAPPVPAKTSADNFFTRENSAIWHIGFKGKDARVEHLTGLFYIGYLLDSFQKPRKSISCCELYRAVSGKTPDKIMSEGSAIGEGLNIGSSKQGISDHKAQQDYWRQWQKLQEDIDNAEDNPEGDMVKKESKKEQDKITPYLNLKGKTFADPNDKKAQVNVGKCLERAYEAISEVGMEDLEKHLRDHIENDGAYGVRYSGAVLWEITIK